MSRSLLVAAVCGLFSLVAGNTAQAAFISGGLGISPGSTAIAPNPGNLMTATTFNFTPGTTNSATGNFVSAVPNGSAVTITALSFASNAPNAPATVLPTFSFGILGSITTTSGMVDQVITFGNTTFFNATLFGTAIIPGYDPTMVTIAFTATKTGNSPVVSTFSVDAAPPPPTPAPASLAVLGLAFPGLLAARRLRNKTA